MTGYKQRLAGTMPLERAVNWMRTLNKDAAEACARFEPNAVTDVTGFGLFGHAQEMADRSGVADSRSSRSGSLRSTVRSTCAARASRTSGDPRNREFAAKHVDVVPGAPRSSIALGYDPQTAGGLLVSLPARARRRRSRRSSSRRACSSGASGIVEEGRGVVVE